jgi:anti-anti-sigma regulatory factor
MAGDLTRLVLPAVVDLDALDGVRDELLEAVERGSVIIDGGAVERLSTNTLIMLLSAAETTRTNGYSFVIEAASTPFKTAIARLGFGPRLAEIMRV